MVAWLVPVFPSQAFLCYNIHIQKQQEGKQMKRKQTKTRKQTKKAQKINMEIDKLVKQAKKEERERKRAQPPAKNHTLKFLAKQFVKTLTS